MELLVKDAITLLESIADADPTQFAVDRKHVVAHATLAALLHHWPEERRDDRLRLLECTNWIRTAENSRWIKQRRIAIGKLARIWNERTQAAL